MNEQIELMNEEETPEVLEFFKPFKKPTNEELAELAVTDLSIANGQKYKVVEDTTNMIRPHKVVTFVTEPNLEWVYCVKGIVGPMPDVLEMCFKYTDAYPVAVIGRRFKEENENIPVETCTNIYDRLVDNFLIREVNKRNLVPEDEESVITHAYKMVELTDEDPFTFKILEEDEEYIPENFAERELPIRKVGESFFVKFGPIQMKEVFWEEDEDFYEVLCNSGMITIQLYKVVHEVFGDDDVPATYVIDSNFLDVLTAPYVKPAYVWSLTPETIFIEEERIRSNTEYTVLLSLFNHYKNTLGEMGTYYQQAMQAVQLQDAFKTAIDTSLLNGEDVTPELADSLSEFSAAHENYDEVKDFIGSYSEIRATLQHLIFETDSRMRELFGEQLQSPKFINEQLVKGLVERKENMVRGQEAGSLNVSAKAMKRLDRTIESTSNRYDLTSVMDKLKSNGPKLKKEISKLTKRAKNEQDKVEVLEFNTLSYLKFFNEDLFNHANLFLEKHGDPEKDALKNKLFIWYLTSRAAAGYESGTGSIYRMQLFNMEETLMENFDIELDVEDYAARMLEVRDTLFSIVGW